MLSPSSVSFSDASLALPFVPSRSCSSHLLNPLSSFLQLLGPDSRRALEGRERFHQDLGRSAVLKVFTFPSLPFLLVLTPLRRSSVHFTPSTVKPLYFRPPYGNYNDLGEFVKVSNYVRILRRASRSHTDPFSSFYSHQSSLPLTTAATRKSSSGTKILEMRVESPLLPRRLSTIRSPLNRLILN